jgi:hypothetical protein
MNMFMPAPRACHRAIPRLMRDSTMQADEWQAAAIAIYAHVMAGFAMHVS